MNPLKIFQIFREWRARRSLAKYVSMVTNSWLQTSSEIPVDVQHLEGFRGLASTSLMDRKLIRLIGRLEVKSPIEVTTTAAVYDLSNCTLVAHCLPVLVVRGFSNCFSEVSIELLPGADPLPVETLEAHEHPSGEAVISGYIDTGSAFLDFSIRTPEVVTILDSCSATKPKAPEAVLD